MEPFRVIEGFDVIEDSGVGLLPGLERVPVQPFSLEGAPERLHGGIVIAMALGAHTGLDATGAQQRPEAATGILDAPIRMVK